MEVSKILAEDSEPYPYSGARATLKLKVSHKVTQAKPVCNTSILSEIY